MPPDVRKLNESFKRTGSWAAGITMPLVALPFLWGAGYMTYRSLWFQHEAARAEGTVVEVTSGTPTLTVEFRTADGQTRRTESGGSDLYKGWATGDKITVYYDPQHPADARLDLWIENWLLPLITVVPGAIILLAMVLIISSMRGRDPFEKPEFETGGTLVQAEFVRVLITPDFDPGWDAKRAPGDFTLTERDGRWELTHNGQKRDPYDPAVQRELGLCYVIEARGKDPVSPMTWGVDSHIIERFGQAGVPKEKISLVKDTYSFISPDKSPTDVIELFRRFYGPTMNAFEAAQKAGREEELRKQLLELATAQNKSTGHGTSIPATFLRVTVRL